MFDFKKTTGGRRGLAALPVLALLLAAPVGADGDDEQAQPLKSEKKEYVEVNVSNLPASNTIGTKMQVPLQESPLSIGSVTSTVIREQQDLRLTDTLSNISGINVQPGSGTFDFFVVRGFDSLSSAIIMTDGAQEPEVTFYPTYNVEGVEVLKAPSGFLYGPNGLAGAVNIVRKQPLDTNFLRLSALGGSFGTVQGTLDWNATSAGGNFGFRLNGMWNESDNFRDDMQSTQRGLNPAFSWKLGDDSKLTFNLEYVKSEYSPDSGIPLHAGAVPDVPRERSYQTPFDFSEQETSRAQLDWEQKLSDKLTLRNKTYYRGLDWNSAGTIFNGTLDFGVDVFTLRTQTQLVDDQEFMGNQFETVFSLGNNIEHQLLVGVEIARQDDLFDIGVVPPDGTVEIFPGVFAPGVPAIGLFNPVETYDGSGAVLPFFSGDAGSTIIAPYVIDQIKFSPRWQLMVGARYDNIDTDVEYTADPIGQSPFSIKRDDSNVSPMLGLVFAPDASLSFYANAGESFAPASFRQIGDLGPEESMQIEIGAKKQFLGDKLQTTFALYQVDRQNIGIANNTGVVLTPGDQESRGFEVELATELPSRLRTLFSYAYNDSELTDFTEFVFDIGQNTFVPVDRSGNVAPFAPEHLASFWISKSFQNGFGVAGGPTYVSSQFIAPDNSFKLDSYVVLDATVFWSFKDCRVNLTLKNLTDEEYDLRGFGSFSVIPAPGLGAYVGFDYTF